MRVCVGGIVLGSIDPSLCVSDPATMLCAHPPHPLFRSTGQNFNLRQLGICEPATRRGLAFCAEMGLPHRGYSVGAGSDVDTENEGVMSPERAMRLWGRGVKSGGRSSCLSSRSNSALTLTDTEHENKSDSENGECHHPGDRLFVCLVCFFVCLSLA